MTADSEQATVVSGLGSPTRKLQAPPVLPTLPGIYVGFLAPPGYRAPQHLEDTA